MKTLEVDPIRRATLKHLAVATLGLLTSTGLNQVVRNEDFRSPLVVEDLQTRARERLRGRIPLFGSHPDFEKPHFDPWAQLEKTKEAVGALDMVGLFPKIEYFADPAWTANFLSQLEQIAVLNAEPVLGLGYVDAVAGEHPFSPKVSHIRKQHFLGICQELKTFGSPVTVRLFFEMNLPAYCYGKNRELTNKQHVEGYKQVFAEFVEAVRITGAEIKTSFNPSVQHRFLPHPFEEYWPLVDNELLADSAGLDGYHLFPGKRQWTHPYYWVPGQHTAQDVFESSFQTLDRLCNTEIPWYIWELGSLCRDSTFLSQAFWLALAHGGSGAMHFAYDKSHHKAVHETNWMMTADNSDAYRAILQTA